MIWLDRQILQPAGEKVGRVFIGGAWWDVWQAKMGWNYIAYEMEVPTDSIQLDLMDFINDSLSRGYINRSWYLHNLQAGFEIQAGGEGLTSHSFSVLINGGEETGHQIAHRRGETARPGRLPQHQQRMPQQQIPARSHAEVRADNPRKIADHHMRFALGYPVSG